MRGRYRGNRVEKYGEREGGERERERERGREGEGQGERREGE